MIKSCYGLLRNVAPRLFKPQMNREVHLSTTCDGGSGGNGGFAKQNFDYFLILDFEATCDRVKQPTPMEIIEFPCLKMNAQTFEVEDTFHRYVRPTVNPELSLFCVELTNILQETVDEADTFETVFADFRSWMIESNLVNHDESPNQRFAFITYSDSDLKKLLPRQCKYLKIVPPFYTRHWIDVRKSYTDDLNTAWPLGQMQLLKELGINSVGHSHSGINDAYDLANIVRQIALRGHEFSINSS